MRKSFYIILVLSVFLSHQFSTVFAQDAVINDAAGVPPVLNQGSTIDAQPVLNQDSTVDVPVIDPIIIPTPSVGDNFGGGTEEINTAGIGDLIVDTVGDGIVGQTMGIGMGAVGPTQMCNCQIDNDGSCSGTGHNGRPCQLFYIAPFVVNMSGQTTAQVVCGYTDDPNGMALYGVTGNYCYLGGITNTCVGAIANTMTIGVVMVNGAAPPYNNFCYGLWGLSNQANVCTPTCGWQ